MDIHVNVHHIIGLSPGVWVVVFIFAIGFVAVSVSMLYPMLASSPALFARPVEEPVARQPMGFHP